MRVVARASFQFFPYIAYVFVLLLEAMRLSRHRQLGLFTSREVIFVTPSGDGLQPMPTIRRPLAIRITHTKNMLVSIRVNIDISEVS